MEIVELCHQWNKIYVGFPSALEPGGDGGEELEFIFAKIQIFNILFSALP